MRMEHMWQESCTAIGRMHEDQPGTPHPRKKWLLTLLKYAFLGQERGLDI